STTAGRSPRGASPRSPATRRCARRTLAPRRRMLELVGVSTRYGPITMLRQVSLAVETGRIACLLGPNGAGKTTLIRTILGIVRPVAGVVRLAGTRIDGLRTHESVKRGSARELAASEVVRHAYLRA